jgi:dethiobiotin synthetase
MGVGEMPEDAEGLTAPQIFAFPGSAQLAARLEGRRVNLKRITRSVEECARRRDLVLVESAGGLFVPLTSSVLTIDYLVERGWPLVLVTNGRLGSINHTLMSIEAAAGRGIEIVAVVYDWAPDVDPAIDRDTPMAIKAYLKRKDLDVPLVRLKRA